MILFFLLSLLFRLPKCSSKFSIEAVTVGGVSLCSYSELLKITDFKTGNFLQKTLSGRLFCGAIGEGSEKRLVIVKTWDVLLPYRGDLAQSLPKFCVCLLDMAEFNFLSVVLVE